MAVPTLLHHDHQVLGTEFCSGYVDAFGKWNTGFFCPPLENQGDPLFCCGIPTFKYCCTGKEKINAPLPSHAEDPLLLVLAITLGVAAGVTLLTLLACFVCPGCLLHKKRRPASSLHSLPYTSTERNCSSRNGRTTMNAVSSTYSLTDPLCSRTTSLNEIVANQARRSQASSRPSDGSWNRSVRDQLSQNSEAAEEYDRIITPPPPYDCNLVPLRSVFTIAPTNRSLNESLVRHTSPRQPTLCIVTSPHSNVNKF